MCGQCGGRMYCTSSQRGEQYALYCSAQRTTGGCPGTYRTRHPVEAAVGLWLQQYARELEQATREALSQRPARRDPHRAERRRLANLLEGSDSKQSRLLDAYTDGALDLAEYKRRRDLVNEERDQARRRLDELAELEEQVFSVDSITSFAETWVVLPVHVRRDVCRPLLTAVRIHADKTVEVLPRWGQPVTVTFTKRGTVPVLLESHV